MIVCLYSYLSYLAYNANASFYIFNRACPVSLYTSRYLVMGKFFVYTVTEYEMYIFISPTKFFWKMLILRSYQRDISIVRPGRKQAKATTASGNVGLRTYQHSLVVYFRNFKKAHKYLWPWQESKFLPLAVSYWLSYPYYLVLLDDRIYEIENDRWKSVIYSLYL
jgi:hypothetical protein